MLAAGVTMRGSDRQTGSMFSYVSPEALVPADHPLRPIRVLVNRALERLSGEFDELYAAGGRDSIAPEKLLRALLLQALYSVRSERRLMEQITYNMLFRWFIGLSMDAPVWDVTVFTKNRDRLLRGEVAGKFFAAVLADPQVKPLLSSEHFSVDGTLIEAWASMKSFRPKDGSGAPPEGRLGRTARPGPEWGTRLPRREAQQRDPCLDHGPGCAAGAEVERAGLEALLHRARGDREPARPGGGGHDDAGDRHCRAGCGRGDDGGAGSRAAKHSGRGQELRYAGLRGGDARPGRDAPRGAAHEWPALGD